MLLRLRKESGVLFMSLENLELVWRFVRKRDKLFIDIFDIIAEVVRYILNRIYDHVFEDKVTVIRHITLNPLIRVNI